MVSSREPSWWGDFSAQLIKSVDGLCDQDLKVVGASTGFTLTDTDAFIEDLRGSIGRSSEDWFRKIVGSRLTAIPVETGQIVGGTLGIVIGMVAAARCGPSQNVAKGMLAGGLLGWAAGSGIGERAAARLPPLGRLRRTWLRHDLYEQLRRYANYQHFDRPTFNQTALLARARQQYPREPRVCYTSKAQAEDRIMWDDDKYPPLTAGGGKPEVRLLLFSLAPPGKGAQIRVCPCEPFPPSEPRPTPAQLTRLMRLFGLSDVQDGGGWGELWLESGEISTVTAFATRYYLREGDERAVTLACLRALAELGYAVERLLTPMLNSAPHRPAPARFALAEQSTVAQPGPKIA